MQINHLPRSGDRFLVPEANMNEGQLSGTNGEFVNGLDWARCRRTLLAARRPKPKLAWLQFRDVCDRRLGGFQVSFLAPSRRIRLSLRRLCTAR